jgi:hypothetical protein
MRWSRCLCPMLGLVAWIAACQGTGAAIAQEYVAPLNEPPRVFGDYSDLLRKEMALPDPTPPSRTPKLQFFRMPSGFMATPLGLYPDEDPPLEDGSAKPADDDLGFLQITYGTHIPYLDMYRKGDPGGPGYYKVHSQVQIFDLGTTNVSAVVQAVTPMGLQNGGAANGPTVLSPAIACFQDLGDGTALHAYVGQHIASNSTWRDQLHSGFRCGLAVQQPVPLTTVNGEQGIYVFVQALGQYRTDNFRPDGNRPGSWEVIPGVQYRVNSACWMSLGISRYNFLSCTWQY